MIHSRSLTGPLGLSLAAIVLIVGAVAARLPEVWAIAAAPDVAEVAAEDRVATLVRQFESQSTTDEARFVGRSPFFLPDPPPPVQPERPVATTPPPPSGPAPAPASYGGEMPIVILGDEVWFQTGAGSAPRKIRRGESAGGIRVVEIDAPWSVTLAWTKPGHVEGEYVVSLFESTDGFLPPDQAPALGDRFPGVTPVTEAAPSEANESEEEAARRRIGRMPERDALERARERRMEEARRRGAIQDGGRPD